MITLAILLFNLTATIILNSWIKYFFNAAFNLLNYEIDFFLRRFQLKFLIFHECIHLFFQIFVVKSLYPRYLLIHLLSFGIQTLHSVLYDIFNSFHLFHESLMSIPPIIGILCLSKTRHLKKNWICHFLFIFFCQLPFVFYYKQKVTKLYYMFFWLFFILLNWYINI